ncbi:MAG: ABC transporter permease [Thermoplasmatales archaeon]|nr:ABC transporter permease [Candidatus Thermoplasmatota archaeon]MCL6002990.1 ABC transporter permease [Candidatus Thermoplasmatota archaeon]MDA8054492.1 ABC transporter permease [Thermoplasmatales archaeon]
MNEFQKYLSKRVLFAIVSVLVIISFDFFLFRLMPGNPILIDYRSPALTRQQIEALSKQFGLNLPIWEQYVLFMKNTFEGNFGISIFYKQSVSSVLFPALYNSLILLLPATIIAIFLGIFTGKFAAWRRGSASDGVVTGTSMAIYSIPTFWLGGIFILIAIKTHAFPVSGMYVTGAVYSSVFAQLSDLLDHLVLPLATLTLVLFGQFTIIMRNSLIDVLQEDYINFAKSKGASDRYILNKHAVPNAELPMISIIAVNLGLTVGGAILTEVVFSWPGIGFLIYSAINARDYPILQAAFVIIAIVIVLANIIADILYSYLDPRIRYQ